MSTRFGFLSTYPPTQCGLATFTHALRKALMRGADEGWVIELAEAATVDLPADVVAQWLPGDQVSRHKAVAALNRCDIAVIQHEYGVYGGADGDEILLLLNEIDVPTIVVLHTVLTHPSDHQRAVLEDVIARADGVVTMTATARDRLAGYRVDLGKVRTIPHGAPEVPLSAASATMPTFRTARPTVLTWGLLGPGKGIEWGIEAMSRLRDLDPSPHYLIAGKTHPKVLAHEGEAYRTALAERIRSLGLSATVSFDSRYRDDAALGQLVRSADVVLLPYDSTEQITSGVLIEAVAAGRPVVATQFPHAVELLASGAGIVVAHRDPIAIADAVRTILTHPGVASRMSAAGTQTAPQVRWSAVAERYRELAQQLITDRIAA